MIAVNFHEYILVPASFCFLFWKCHFYRLKQNIQKLHTKPFNLFQKQIGAFKLYHLRLDGYHILQKMDYEERYEDIVYMGMSQPPKSEETKVFHILLI